VISATPGGPSPDPGLPSTYPRLDRPAPDLGLVDQHGEVLELGALRGRPALVTFAFGHCESVCPAVVRQVLDARERSDAAPAVVVVTLDPWRDTPASLPRVARHWRVDEGAFLLSGEVGDVNRVLDAWNVARKRNESTGEVIHPPLVYVLDATGRIAYAATGGVDALVELLDRV
jgi:protein SCO1/2